MVLIETKPGNLAQPQVEWILPLSEERSVINPKEFEVKKTLYFINEGCSKNKRKKFYKETYQKIMEQYPQASYQERLEISKKFITDLQEKNPNINPRLLNTMRRSFAAKTGYAITKLKKELKDAESSTMLANGKEIKSKHPWTNAINSVLGNDNKNKKQERSVLVKILDFRINLKSLILTSHSHDSEEMLKICENHIADLITKNNFKNTNAFLSRECINNLLNPQQKESSVYISQVANNREPQTLESWVKTVVKNNTQTRFSIK